MKGDEMLRYMVVLEGSADGYEAYTPDIPGCGTTDATIDEALANIKEALELWLAVNQERGGTAPQLLHQFAAFVEVDVPVTAQS
jgi:predicted RNase H-like HicB family nuclease